MGTVLLTPGAPKSIAFEIVHGTTQAGHGPPQSTPVSPWFLMPSLQVPTDAGMHAWSSTTSGGVGANGPPPRGNSVDTVTGPRSLGVNVVVQVPPGPVVVSMISTTPEG